MSLAHCTDRLCLYHIINNNFSELPSPYPGSSSSGRACSPFLLASQLRYSTFPWPLKFPACFTFPHGFLSPALSPQLLNAYCDALAGGRRPAAARLKFWVREGESELAAVQAELSANGSLAPLFRAFGLTIAEVIPVDTGVSDLGEPRTCS